MEGTRDVIIQPSGIVGSPLLPDDEENGPGINWTLIVGIVVALAVFGAVLFIGAGKCRTPRYEAKMDAEEKR